MKFLKGFFLSLFLVVFVVFIGAFVYVDFFAKKHIQAKLNQSLSHPIEIGSLSFNFPMGLQAKSIKVNEFLQAKRAYVQINPKTLLEKTIEIESLKLIEPIFVVKKDKQESLPIQKQSSGKSDKLDQQVDAANLAFVIKKIVITNGQLIYEKRQADHPLAIKLVNLKGEIGKVDIPLRSEKTEFEFDSLSDEKNSRFYRNRIVASGWIDVLKKDMEGLLNVFDEKGQSQLKAQLNAKDNELDVEGTISYNKEGKPQDLSTFDIYTADQLLFNAFNKLGVEVGEVNFSFPTKLDDFQIDRVTFKGKGVVAQ